MSEPLPEYLTTGPASRLCGVNSKTLRKWWDAGMIKGWGFLIPGTRNRQLRIQARGLALFMQKHEMPLPPALAELLKEPS